MTANGNNHTNGTKNSEQLFNEAPASWNSKYLDPSGFECMITLRGASGSELLEKAAGAIAYLLKNGCIPYVYRAGGRLAESKAEEPKNGKGESDGNGNNGNNHNPSWCPIHGVEMRRFEKEGRSWFSHKAGQKWCKGK